MVQNRLWSALALIAVLTLVLTACGSPPPSAPAAEVTSAPVAEAPAAQVTEAPPIATDAPAAVPQEPAAGESDAAGELPADAAPPEQQVYIVHYDNTADFTTVDFYESVYKRGGAPTELLSD